MNWHSYSLLQKRFLQHEYFNSYRKLQKSAGINCVRGKFISFVQLLYFKKKMSQVKEGNILRDKIKIFISFAASKESRT